MSLPSLRCTKCNEMQRFHIVSIVQREDSATKMADNYRLHGATIFDNLSCLRTVTTYLGSTQYTIFIFILTYGNIQYHIIYYTHSYLWIKTFVAQIIADAYSSHINVASGKQLTFINKFLWIKIEWYKSKAVDEVKH